jgi:DNA-binding NarL/FixJ family response regulator
MNDSPQIVVAIIDDHEAIRVGLSAALRAADRPLRVEEGAATVPEFLAAARSPGADVVLLDLNLGDGSDPKDNAEALRVEGYRVLVYSIADNVRMLRRALAGGADGVCRKAEPIAETVEAIVSVAAGRQVISQEILAAIEGDAHYVAAALGRREREVLSLYAAGLEIPQIGRALYITENSVKEYLKRIRAKYTQVDRPAASKLELFRRAVEDGIVPPVEPRY